MSEEWSENLVGGLKDINHDEVMEEIQEELEFLQRLTDFFYEEIGVKEGDGVSGEVVEIEISLRDIEVAYLMFLSIVNEEMAVDDDDVFEQLMFGKLNRQLTLENQDIAKHFYESGRDTFIEELKNEDVSEDKLIGYQ